MTPFDNVGRIHKEAFIVSTKGLNRDRLQLTPALQGIKLGALWALLDECLRTLLYPILRTRPICPG